MTKSAYTRFGTLPKAERSVEERSASCARIGHSLMFWRAKLAIRGAAWSVSRVVPSRAKVRSQPVRLALRTSRTALRSPQTFRARRIGPRVCDGRKSKTTTLPAP